MLVDGVRDRRALEDPPPSSPAPRVLLDEKESRQREVFIRRASRRKESAERHNVAAWTGRPSSRTRAACAPSRAYGRDRRAGAQHRGRSLGRRARRPKGRRAHTGVAFDGIVLTDAEQLELDRLGRKLSTARRRHGVARARLACAAFAASEDGASKDAIAEAIGRGARPIPASLGSAVGRREDRSSLDPPEEIPLHRDHGRGRGLALWPASKSPQRSRNGSRNARDVSRRS